MPRRAKSQREPNSAIERLANANVRRSNVYCDPLTLDKILRRNEQRGAPIRTRSELPRWNIQRPTHSPDGKPPPLPRLTWLPFIDVMNQQKSTSSSPTTTRRVPFY
uniref:Uncharacterized protein n=1 Tax=Plectus sambesii TaxID=2011161 RepID=A0A914UL64_9BILA